MLKENLIFELTSNLDVANKLIKDKKIDLISTAMLNDEIQMLCENKTLLKALKINNIPHNKTIYIFEANKKNKEYSNHNLSSVKVIVNSQNLDINEKNITFLDGYINKSKNLNIYQTCNTFFEVGVINETAIQGFSIGTYSTSKKTKEFTIKSDLKLNNNEQNNWNNYIIYDEHLEQYDQSYEPGLDKSYVLKG